MKRTGPPRCEERTRGRCALRRPPAMSAESTDAPAEAGVGSPPSRVLHGRGSTLREHVQVPG